MTVKTYALGGLFADSPAGFAFNRECLVVPVYSLSHDG